jgi:hypothetical protein
VPIRIQPYLMALGDIGDNILDARSAHNCGPSSLLVDDGLNVLVHLKHALGRYFWKPLPARLQKGNLKLQHGL